MSKAKPEFKNCQKPRKSSREKEERNEPRIKYLRAAFCERDKNALKYKLKYLKYGNKILL